MKNLVVIPIVQVGLVVSLLAFRSFMTILDEAKVVDLFR